MLNYLKFLLFVNLKRKGLYICFIVLIGTFCMFFIPTTNNVNGGNTQALFPIDRYTRWFPFLFSTVFSSLLIVRTFKTGETDGTELLISAKPITRKKMILTKFINVFVLLILFHIFLFGFYMSISQIDSYATTDQKIRFSGSLVIGGFIISIIISSVIILFSSVLGSTGTVVSGILFATISPILSFTLTPISGAYSLTPDEKFGDEARSYLLPEEISGWTDKENKNDISKMTKFSFFYENRKKRIESNKNTWYKYVKYFDIWYHLGRFYNLLQLKEKHLKSSFEPKIAKYKKVDKNRFDDFIEKGRKTALNFDNSLYVPMFSKKELIFEKKQWQKQSYQVKFKNLTRKNGALILLIKKINDEWNSYADSLKPEEKLLKFKKFINEELKLLFLLTEVEVNLYSRIILWRIIKKYEDNNQEFEQVDDESILNQEAQQYIEFKDLMSSLLLNFKKNDNIKGIKAININEFKSDSDDEYSYEILSKNYFLVTDYKEDKFIETKHIIIFYSVAGFIFIITSIVVCLRKDFK